MQVPASNASHDQKHVAPDFDYLDQTKMVPLMMPLGSHDNDVGGNGIT